MLTNPYPLPLHFDNAGMRNGRRCIVLTRRFKALTSLGLVDAPASMVSDGGSIPAPAWSILSESGLGDSLEAFVIHDYLYSPLNTDYTRAEADFIMKELMWNTGISRWKIAAFYVAVRMFGGRHFKARIPNL